MFSRTVNRGMRALADKRRPPRHPRPRQSRHTDLARLCGFTGEPIAGSGRASGLAHSTSWRLALLCVVVAVAFATPRAAAAENVALAVNGDSWMSRTVANHYAALRPIPASHVVYLQGLPDLERIDVERFRQLILKPVIETLQQRQRWDQIDYLVYSSDVPYIIDLRGDLRSRTLPMILTPAGSLNGLTFLYQQVLKRDPNYMSLQANPYFFGRLLPPIGERPPPETDRPTWELMGKLLRQQNWQAALDRVAALIERHPRNATLYYTRACCQAQLGDANLALESLDKAIAFGWYNHQIAANEPRLASLRSLKPFQSRLQRMDEMPWPIPKTVGFRAADRGKRAVSAGDGSGRRYLLSTVLATTTGRGNSLDEVIDYLRRSRSADGSFPAGSVYFPVNSDQRSRLREALYGPAVRALQANNVRGQIPSGALPQNQSDVIGLTTGTATFQWRQSGSVIVPGAICEHLTSSGGILLETAIQTPLTEFLRWGAAGASGTVREPYSVPEKFPSPFLHVHYTRGCTLAEAYYQSVAGPYQLLIVGDPLCRPWARIPRFDVTGITVGATLRGHQTWQPITPTERDNGVPIRDFTLYIDGLRRAVQPPGKPFLVDARTLAEGHHLVALVATAANPLATTGRRSFPVTVHHRGQSVELRCDQHEVGYHEQLQLHVRSPGARSISVFHHRQPVGTVIGSQGVLRLAAKTLGLGPVRLWAQARHDDSETGPVLSRPLSLTVLRPRPIAGLTHAPSGFAPGVLLTTDGRRHVITYPLQRAAWLESLSLRRGATFSIEAYFDVARKSLFQLQLQSNCQPQLYLNNRQQPVLESAGEAWSLVPVVLEPGTHRLSLTGKVTQQPRLRLRLGSTGTRSLDGLRFRHRRRQ